MGYSGGSTDNPTYKDVCTGRTGHAEVVQVEYDPNQVSFEKLLELFYQIHNPLIPLSYCGGQYRSVIFFHSEEQERAAREHIAQLSKISPLPIQTEVSPAPKFYLAEDYHQDYYKKSGKARACRF